MRLVWASGDIDATAWRRLFFGLVPDRCRRIVAVMGFLDNALTLITLLSLFLLGPALGRALVARLTTGSTGRYRSSTSPLASEVHADRLLFPDTTVVFVHTTVSILSAFAVRVSGAISEIRRSTGTIETRSYYAARLGGGLGSARHATGRRCSCCLCARYRRCRCPSLDCASSSGCLDLRCRLADQRSLSRWRSRYGNCWPPPSMGTSSL